MKRTKEQKFNQKRTAVLLLLLWFALAWSWTLSTESLSLSGSRSMGLIVAAVVSLINVSISAYVLWQALLLVRRIFTTHHPAFALVMALGVFAVADFLAAWLTAFIWIGPEGNIDNVLPLGSPTLLLINTPFGYASRLLGFYGLAAFGWLGIFLFTSRHYRKLSVYIITSLCVFSFAGWLLYRSPNGSIIQAKIVNEKLMARVPPVDGGDATFVLFPEYGLDGLRSGNLSTRLVVDPSKPVKFIGSEQFIGDTSDGSINSLLYGDTKQGAITKQNKHRLIPGGEDLPYIVHASLLLTRQQSTIDYFSFAKKIYKGQEQLQPLQLDNQTTVGAAVCSSIISPEDYRHLTRNGATLLTNSASLGVFKDSLVFSWQQKSLAKFMAISNARYFLQAANDASSYALDTNGAQRAGTNRMEVLTTKIQNNHRKTLYTFIGEWAVVSGSAAVTYSLITVRHTKQSHKKK